MSAQPLSQWTVMSPSTGAGVCCQFANKGLSPASYIFFFSFVLLFGNRDGQDILIYGYSIRYFIQESKHWEHPNNGIFLKGFFYNDKFFKLYEIESHYVFILKKRFPMICILFKLIYYCTFHPILHTIPSMLNIFLIILLFWS
jgi:hypothetical protein